MNEEELEKIKERIKTDRIEHILALYFIAFEEIKKRMEKKDD